MLILGSCILLSATFVCKGTTFFAFMQIIEKKNAEFVDFVGEMSVFYAGRCFYMLFKEEMGLLQEDGFEGGREFGVSGEFFGELCEDSGAFEVTAGAKAGIAVKDEGGEGIVCGDAVVNEGREHLLIAEVRFELFVGSRMWVHGSTIDVEAVCGGLCGKIRVLQQEFGIERSRSHLLTMGSLGIGPVVGLVLVTIGRIVDAEKTTLGDFGLLAENLAANGLDGGLVGCFGHSCIDC